MVLVLTYHRIVDRPDGLNSFFDVTIAELEAHLLLLKQTWSRGVSPDEFSKLRTHRSREQLGFLITFDDGTPDHYLAAAPVLERNGVRGVFFVNTSLLGAHGYLTLDQCVDLNRRGHAIESHAHDHVDLTKVSTDKLEPQLSGSRHILRQAGLGQCKFLAVPGGFFNRAVIDAARAGGYSHVRTVAWGYNRKFDPFQIESVIINRKTAGNWFEPLVRPRFEAAKKFLYQGKELLKNTAPNLYSRWR
jgi:peptidoglycan/xylan/chitin deacetylase (PgdA/CDA1 family)